MTEFNFLARRKFLWTSAAKVATLKGRALIPSPSDLSPEALSLSPAELPETTRIELGYIAIAESASLTTAKEKGFVRYGMTDDGKQGRVPMPHLFFTRARTMICGS